MHAVRDAGLFASVVAATGASAASFPFSAYYAVAATKLPQRHRSSRNCATTEQSGGRLAELPLHLTVSSRSWRVRTTSSSHTGLGGRHSWYCAFSNHSSAPAPGWSWDTPAANLGNWHPGQHCVPRHADRNTVILCAASSPVECLPREAPRRSDAAAGSGPAALKKNDGRCTTSFHVAGHNPSKLCLSCQAARQFGGEGFEANATSFCRLSTCPLRCTQQESLSGQSWRQLLAAWCESQEQASRWRDRRHPRCFTARHSGFALQRPLFQEAEVLAKCQLAQCGGSSRRARSSAGQLCRRPRIEAV
mmetsp:Transcript_24514/g.56501  ORF Transcript_24514/g.56501 Transcript_24514/m.56501 type:complete len:305 (-) Transcript_24514:1242-2156(-)